MAGKFDSFAFYKARSAKEYLRRGDLDDQREKNNLNEGNSMPYNEKEYDGYLFDQLTILERLERIAKKSDNKEIMEEINIIRKEIERKLYRPGSKSE